MSRFRLLLFSLLGTAALHAQIDPAPVAVEPLVAQIVSTHPELRLYEAEIAAARAGVRAAGSRAEPGLNLQLGRRRVTDPAGLLAGEGALWSASISQTFEWPGRLALRRALANRDVELAELGLARFRAALAARARGLAFGLHAAVAEAEAIAEVAARFAELRQTLLAREPAGITPHLEIRALEATQLVLQRRATAAALAADRARIEFNQLRGALPQSPLDLAPPRVAFATAPDLASLLAAAREHNFDYRARRLELARQGDALQLARHETKPEFSLAPFYSRAQAGERETEYGLGLGLTLPFGPRRTAAIDTAQARRQQAEVALQLADRELEREVLSLAHEFSAKVAEVNRWSDGSVASFREAAELADRHYRLGAVPLSTYLELQTSYLDAVEALLATQREAIAAGLRLQEIAGVDFNAVSLAP